RPYGGHTMLAIPASIHAPAGFLERLEAAACRALEILIAAMTSDPSQAPPRESRLAASQVLRLATSIGLFRKADAGPATRVKPAFSKSSPAPISRLETPPRAAPPPAPADQPPESPVSPNARISREISP